MRLLSLSILIHAIIMVCMIITANALLITTIDIAYHAYAIEPRDPNECPNYEIIGQDNPCIREQRETEKEVKFVNLYFGDPNSIVNGFPTKVEVAPGDGVANLIAVMANSGAFELTGVRGWLYLPVGFEAYGRANGEPAFDTYDLKVGRGDTFYFEFPVKVGKDLKPGIYQATLRVEYFRSQDIGLSYRIFNVEFMLTGKSILDAKVSNPILTPGKENTINVEVVNNGSAPASAVIVKITSTSSLLNIGSKVFDLSTIEPNSKGEIELKLYANPSIVNTLQSVQLTLEYTDSYGNRKSTITYINLLVKGGSSSADLRVNVDEYKIRVLNTNDLNIVLSNVGDESAYNVEVKVNVNAINGSPISIIGDGYYKVSKIGVNESIRLPLKVFATNDARNKTFDIPLSITYLDGTGGLHSIDRSVSIYALGEPSIKMYDLQVTFIGTQPNLSGYLLNDGSDDALFTRVGMLADDLKPVAGPQYLGDLLINSPLPFNIPIDPKVDNVKDMYNVKVKVTYKDALREEHEVILDGKVVYSPIRVSSNSSGSSNNTQPTPLTSNTSIIVIGGLVGAGVAGFLIGRRSKKSIQV